MAKNSSTLRIVFRPSVILNLISALTLYAIIMIQFSCCFNNKLLFNFFGQNWTVTWIMGFILLLTISSLFFKARVLKTIFGLIIILVTITSAVGLVFNANGSNLHFFWENSLIPALLAYVISFIGSILWISNL